MAKLVTKNGRKFMNKATTATKERFGGQIE